jgi:catechol 2,3-dioxygenase-like lactoylglutathione lyase family enzyme
VTDIGDSVLNVGYLVDDAAAAVDFHTPTSALACTARSCARSPTSPAATCGYCWPTSSAARPMADGRRPGPGGWTRIHLIVDDIAAEEARLRTAGVGWDIIIGPGGRQMVLDDPAGNPVELFNPAAAR